MKKLLFLFAMTMVTCVITGNAYAQGGQETASRNDQVDLLNDVYASYGLGSIFYFINNEGMSGKSISGTFIAGYHRSINEVIAVGFQVSYTSIHRTEEESHYSYPSGTTTWYNSLDDNLLQGLASIRFRYVNRPSFCMYSGIGMGVTMDYYDKTDQGNNSNAQKLLPAGQLTMLGIRAGRALAFFGEFGIGTNYILNAGISYKFGKN
ncbi:MAG TPA: hypothetical protein PKG48_05050 [Bacteroidales bacterium]|nr:hypothetical protein [Bacteroidales bacterium]HPS62159.1 hypothetical protein [Bacteroidales bacterium]